ncbi:MAG: glycoside hydrolase family 32 protein, partial [Planctomycetes bacterium]|nr:glycoside hydrolase family 32 protein [Planctomycetota bacterium]
PLTLDDKQRTLTLHVFLDKSAMEIFINGGRECVTRVIYPGQDDLGVEAFAEGGSATIRALDVWLLGSIWP